MEPFSWAELIRRLEAAVDGNDPVITRMSRQKRNPFLVLIGTLLSLRTKDETTEKALNNLTMYATTPDGILALPPGKLEEIIFPVGFYRTKAKTLRQVSQTIIEKYKGQVPDTIDELLRMKGVGRKTANLVMTEGFGKFGICVDTHVHRISNRLGIVRSTTPDRTEMALRESLPRMYWIRFNSLLVTFGKTVCTPISPKCSICPLPSLCKRVGVTTSR